MCTYKVNSHRHVGQGLKEVNKYENTVFIIQAGCDCEHWMTELRKLRNSPLWRQCMSWDPSYGMMRYNDEIELQIFDAGNTFMQGEK